MARLNQLAIALILCFLVQTGVEAKIRFTCGYEWGYSAMIYDSFSYNYHTTDGVRVDDSGSGFAFKSNGFVLVNAGAYLGNHFSATINSGFAGIYEQREIFPLSLRATYFLNDYLSDGFKILADAGTAFPMKGAFNDKRLYLLKAGSGFRKEIYDKFCIDLTLAVQYSIDHPSELIDKYTHNAVPQMDIRRSDRNCLALCLSLALCF